MSQTNENSPPKGHIGILDDEPALLRALQSVFRREGYEVTTWEKPHEAILTMTQTVPDTLLIDVHMPEMTGLQFISELNSRRIDVPVLLMTGNGNVPQAVAALHLGAFDYLLKPFDDIDRLLASVRRAVEHKRLVYRNRELEMMVQKPLSGFIGDSPAMVELFRMISRVGPTDSTVLIQGESGTGKELVARALHDKGPRGQRAFVALNCAAMTETLLESELFGHVKGAFTGAHSSKKGLFMAASGGTLFLDEIGDMPQSTQVRLLRALQESEIRPVGSTESQKINARVIAATNVDLRKAVSMGKFREDLYFRLAVMTLQLPALRDRATDIPALAYHFLRLHSGKGARPVERIGAHAMGALVAYRWPGNIRELGNVIERAVLLASSEEITVNEFPRSLMDETRGGSEVLPRGLLALPYPQARTLAAQSFDRLYLKTAVKSANGNMAAAARATGIDRSNFRRMMKAYGMRVEGGEAVLPSGDPAREHIEADAVAQQSSGDMSLNPSETQTVSQDGVPTPVNHS